MLRFLSSAKSRLRAHGPYSLVRRWATRNSVFDPWNALLPRPLSSLHRDPRIGPPLNFPRSCLIFGIFLLRPVKPPSHPVPEFSLSPPRVDLRILFPLDVSLFFCASFWPSPVTPTSSRQGPYESAIFPGLESLRKPRLPCLAPFF